MSVWAGAKRIPPTDSPTDSPTDPPTEKKRTFPRKSAFFFSVGGIRWGVRLGRCQKKSLTDPPWIPPRIPRRIPVGGSVTHSTHPKRIQNASKTHPKRTCIRHGLPNAFPHAIKTQIWGLHNIPILAEPDDHKDNYTYDLEPMLGDL